MLRGLQAGARGYLLKDTRRETLIANVEAAARGEALLKPEILQRVLFYQFVCRFVPAHMRVVLVQSPLYWKPQQTTAAPTLISSLWRASLPHASGS